MGIVFDRVTNRARAAALTLGTASLFFSSAAHAEFYTQPWLSHFVPAKAYHFELGGSVYSTTGNFDATGTSTAIKDLTRYQRIHGGLSAEVGLSSKLSLFGKVRWALASYQLSSTNTGLATSNPSIFGIGDQTAGLAFQLYSDDLFALDLQAQGDFALYSNSAAKTSNLPFLGDGSTDLTGGLFLTLYFNDPGPRRWFLKAGGGYTTRSSSFSAALPWSAMIGTQTTTPGLLLSLGAYGFLSLKNDPNAESTSSTRSDTSAAGGSSFINAINPSLAAVRGSLGYQLSPALGLEASFSLPVWGQAAPNGMDIGGALRISSTPDSRGRNYNRSNRGLVTYISRPTDGDAKIIKTNESLRQVKINKGLSDGVENRQTWDIFLTRKDGSSGEAVARAKVIQVDTASSTLQIVEHFKEVWIEEGFVARRPIE